jgi:acyl-coenzyme A synthetase/AMP-(fatty) acid ligase
VLVIRLEANQEFNERLKQEIDHRNRILPDFKRVWGYVLWERDFPRTASMKIKREILAQEMSKALSRAAMVQL